MESFKAFGRNLGPDGRKGRKNPKRNGLPRVEFLEERRLLTSAPAPLWTPTDTNLFDAQHGPMANLGTSLVSVYQTFVDSNGNTSNLASDYPLDEFQNGLVGVQVKSLGGDFSQFVTQLTDAGMHITDSSSYYGLVDGYTPVNSLPSIAELPQTMAGSVMYKPIFQGAGGEYQGEAYNESETAMQADIARNQFGIDGTGVTVGVLSDSVNQYNGGLASSYATGDLNGNDPVKVIQDLAGGTDEGRAMLENIHDIAPARTSSLPRPASANCRWGKISSRSSRPARRCSSTT